MHNMRGASFLTPSRKTNSYEIDVPHYCDRDDFFQVELKKTVTVSRELGCSFDLIIRESTEGS